MVTQHVQFSQDNLRFVINEGGFGGDTGGKKSRGPRGVVDGTAQATLHERLGLIRKSRRLVLRLRRTDYFTWPPEIPARVVYED